MTEAPRILIAITLLAVGCDEQAQWRRNELAAWNNECHDETKLVATTAGSPSSFKCSNKGHRMRVELAVKSGEEIGAVVFCQCERDGGK